MTVNRGRLVWEPSRLAGMNEPCIASPLRVSSFSQSCGVNVLRKNYFRQQQDVLDSIRPAHFPESLRQCERR